MLGEEKKKSVQNVKPQIVHIERGPLQNSQHASTPQNQSSKSDCYPHFKRHVFHAISSVFRDRL